MCVLDAPRRTMCRSVTAIWSLKVLLIAVTIALTIGVQRVGALTSQPAASLETQRRSDSAPEILEGLQKDAPGASKTNPALDDTNAYRRRALRDERKRWPSAIVPYVIDPSIDKVSLSARSMIKEAIKRWENETCIRFVPANRLKDKDVIVIQQGRWCSSYVGRKRGRQPVKLALGCLNVGSVMHELGHAIGWRHEHTRPDRDKYIEILSEKKKKKRNNSNYAKSVGNRVNTFGIPYDYGSIMHYSAKANRLRALDPTMQQAMGQRRGLSFYDAKLANLMYKCAERNRCNLRSTKCTGEGYVGPKCTCVCRDGSTECAANNTSKKPAQRFSINTWKFNWPYLEEDAN